MYQDFNQQFAAASRQFADTAAQVNRLALSSAEKAFGLQLSTIEQNTNAAFAFWGELAEVRDIDGLKAVWPKGVQTARESIERSVSAGQEAFGQTVATGSSIPATGHHYGSDGKCKDCGDKQTVTPATGDTFDVAMTTLVLMTSAVLAAALVGFSLAAAGGQRCRSCQHTGGL